MYYIRKQGEVIFSKYESERDTPLAGEEAVSGPVFEALKVPCVLRVGADGFPHITPAAPPMVEGIPSPPSQPPAPPPPSAAEIMRADIDYLAALGGVVL